MKRLGARVPTRRSTPGDSPPPACPLLPSCPYPTILEFMAARPFAISDPGPYHFQRIAKQGFHPAGTIE